MQPRIITLRFDNTLAGFPEVPLRAFRRRSAVCAPPDAERRHPGLPPRRWRGEVSGGGRQVFGSFV